MTRFANPLGGGVYVVVPFKASFGEIKVAFSGGVVESPSFFRTKERKTTRQEWGAVSKASSAPWADFETDKYLMQVPRQWIHGYTFEELSALALKWETAMDGVCAYGGYPLARTHKARTETRPLPPMCRQQCGVRSFPRAWGPWAHVGRPHGT